MKTRMRVYRKNWVKYDVDHPRGSGYCADQGTTQYLVKEYLLFGLVVWRRHIDKEEVPGFAVDEHAVFGRSEWKSKFREYIKYV